MPLRFLPFVEDEMIAIVCAMTVFFGSGYAFICGDSSRRMKSLLPVVGWILAQITPLVFPAVIGIPLSLFLLIGSTAFATRLFQTARVDKMTRIANE